MKQPESISASGFLIEPRPQVHKMGLSYGTNNYIRTGKQEWSSNGLSYGGVIWESEGTRKFIITPRIHTGPKGIK